MKNAEAVRTILGLQDGMDLMAVVAIGHPKDQKRVSSRKDLSEVIVKEFYPT